MFSRTSGREWLREGSGFGSPCECLFHFDALPSTEQTELCNNRHRSSALLEGLGWSQPLAGTTIAAQLLAIGRMHPAGSASTNAVENGVGNAAHGTGSGTGSELRAEAGDARTAVSQMLAQLIPQLYRALDGLPAAAFADAAALVSDAPIVWVGNGFAQTDRVALRCVCRAVHAYSGRLKHQRVWQTT